MDNFVFQNPTKLIFGKGMIASLSKEIPLDKKIMVTFGGGSVKKNGVYDAVKSALVNHNYIEFWGIEPNPSIETLRKAIALGKENKVDFLLAVGGGSVIDGTKLISAGLCYDGDAWELVKMGRYMKTVPVATVLTLPATGSEMNSGAVISRSQTKEKYAFYSNFPVFSILDNFIRFTDSRHENLIKESRFFERYGPLKIYSLFDFFQKHRIHSFRILVKRQVTLRKNAFAFPKSFHGKYIEYFTENQIYIAKSPKISLS